MKKKSALQIAMVYACSVVGVGFASGNEILNFFTSYGFKGFLGILVSSVLFSMLGYLTVKVAFKTGEFSIIGCYKSVCGKAFSRVAQTISTLFCFSLFVLMLSAWSSVLEETVSLPVVIKYLTYIFLFVLYCIFDVQSKSIANLMRGIILFGTGGVLAYIVFSKLTGVFTTFGVIKYNLWLVSAFMYIGYNSFVSSELLCKVSQNSVSEKSAKLGGLFGGAVLFILSFLFNLIFTLWYRGTSNFPILDILDQELETGRMIFTFILLICILYSGFNSGMIVCDKIYNRFKVKKILPVLILSLISIGVLPIGFKRLITFIYPAFGVLGLVISLFFIYGSLKLLKEVK